MNDPVVNRLGSVAYLVLTHHEPARVTPLIGALLGDSTATVYVHLDAERPLPPLEAAIRSNPRVILIENRLHVRWGHFSMVEATFALMRAARGHDRLVLLSGDSYPLAPARQLHEHLLAHDRERIEILPLPKRQYRRPWEGRALDRTTRRIEKPFWVDVGYNPLSKIVNRLALMLPSRDYEAHLEGPPVYGSQWWALSGECASYVLDVVDARPALVRFFRRARIPDELLIQNIVAHSPFAERIAPPVLYSLSRPGDDRDRHRLPRVVERPEDIERVLASGALFARKFDFERFGWVREAIDESIRDRATGGPAATHAT